MKTPFGLLFGLYFALGSLAGAVRLKELATVEGVRSNPLMGYGIVVGLAGTGDKRQTVFSAQSLANVLARMGVAVNPNAMQVKNTAAVLVTANLPAFARPGVPLDITVAAIGDSPNLQGGILITTPLKGADGQVYAVAQGSVITGGFSSGGKGSSQTQNHPTTGRIPNGALIERAAPTPALGELIRLQLRQADFTTASRVLAVVNKRFGKTPLIAKAESAGVIAIQVPEEYRDRPVEFMGELENLEIESDRIHKIVINERTGTISLGRDVHIAPITILHGSLTVEIQTNESASQPNPMSTGTTVPVSQTSTKVTQAPARSVALRDGATVEELVRALMAIGSTARDIIAILQNLKANGALDADLEVI